MERLWISVMEEIRCCLYEPILPSLLENVINHLKTTYVFWTYCRSAILLPSNQSMYTCNTCLFVKRLLHRNTTHQATTH